jgi:hypothetical protein
MAAILGYLDPQVLALIGAITISTIGIAWAFVSRIPLVTIPSSKASQPLNEGMTFRRSKSVREAREKRWADLLGHLVLQRLDEKSHDLECSLSLIVPLDFLLSLRRVRIGPGALGEHPSIISEDRNGPGQLVLVDAAHDPVVCLSILSHDPDAQIRETVLRWKASELVARYRQGKAVLSTDVAVPCLFHTAAYPADRYSTGFWISLHAPPGHYFESSGSAFIIYPTLIIRSGPELLHWDVRLANRSSEGSVTSIALQRTRTERWTTYFVHLIPLGLSLLIAATLTKTVDGTDERGVVLRAASVFLALISLRTVIPGPGKSFGRTRADVLLLTAVMSMTWILALDLVSILSAN